MATPTARTAARFEADVRTALETASKATTGKTRKAKGSYFAKWVDFCKELGHDPALSKLQDADKRLTYLLVFGLRYRLRAGRGGKPVRADSVAKALAAVGQGMVDMGQPDPRKPIPGGKEYYPLLADFLGALRKQDDPAYRVYPANVTILRALVDVLDTEHAIYGWMNEHIIDLIIVAFFWLLRPAEYLNEPDQSDDSRSQAFRFRDIQLNVGGVVYSAPDAPLNDANSIQDIRHAWLTFTDQKNANKGERIGHAATQDRFFCGAKALGRIARRFKRQGAKPDTPIAMHYNQGDHRWYRTKAQHVTNALRHAAIAVQPTTGIDPDQLSARSLRPGGATALMMAGIDKDNIALMGRWRSDAMLQYLRVQVATHTKNYAQQMLDNGSYTFAPDALQQNTTYALPQETPPTFRKSYQTILEHPELYNSDPDE